MAHSSDDLDVPDKISFEVALSMGDLILRLDDERTIMASKFNISMASSVLRQALLQPGVENEAARTRRPLDGAPAVPDGSSSCNMMSIPVEGEFEDWLLLLQHLYAPVLTGRTPALTLNSALRMMPIAHKYNMVNIMDNCVEAVKNATLSTSPTPYPLDSQEPQPGLFQWLAMGDAKQYRPLVQACLDQLSQQGAVQTMRAALGSEPEVMRRQLDGSRPETLTDVIYTLTGVPLDYKGIQVPHLVNTEPSFMQQTSYLSPGLGTWCGSLLVYAKDIENGVGQALEVLDTADGTFFQLPGHLSRITVLAAGSEGSSAASLLLRGYLDGCVSLWDLSSRSDLGPLQDLGNRHIHAACFVGGSRAAAGGGAGSIAIWDVDTQDLTMTLGSREEHGREDVRGLAASSDGHLILEANENGCLYLWDVRQRTHVRTMTGHTKSSAFTVALDGQACMAVSVFCDNTVMTWDLGSGRCSTVLPSPGLPVLGIQVDPAGTKAIGFCGEDFSSNDFRCLGSVCVWNLVAGTLSASHSWPDEQVYNACASADLSKIAMLTRRTHVHENADDACCIRLWTP